MSGRLTAALPCAGEGRRNEFDCVMKRRKSTAKGKKQQQQQQQLWLSILCLLLSLNPFVWLRLQLPQMRTGASEDVCHDLPASSLRARADRLDKNRPEDHHRPAAAAAAGRRNGAHDSNCCCSVCCSLCARQDQWHTPLKLQLQPR